MTVDSDPCRDHDTYDMIHCRFCHRASSFIKESHLKTHGMTKEDYVKMGYPTSSKAHKDRVAKNSSKMWAERTPSERQEVQTKQSKGVKGFWNSLTDVERTTEHNKRTKAFRTTNESKTQEQREAERELRAQSHKQQWANLTAEERSFRVSSLRKSNRDFWNNLSDGEKEDIYSGNGAKISSFWSSRTEDEKAEHRKKVSLSCKALYSSMSAEEHRRLSEIRSAQWYAKSLDERITWARNARMGHVRDVYESPRYGRLVFRSSWESKLARFLDVSKVDFLYEGLTFPWIDAEGKSRLYITDFYLSAYNLVIEVKPYCYIDDYEVNEKRMAVENAGFKFLFVTEYELDSLDTWKAKYLTEVHANQQPSLGSNTQEGSETNTCPHQVMPRD
jgi:hypothetical protein